MSKRIKVLVLVKPFWLQYPKHKAKAAILKTITTYADVYYWYNDGDIHDILTHLNLEPDFIFHYDIAWGYRLSPRITGLEQITIPKGCFVIDLHWKPQKRIEYIEQNRIDIIFSVSNRPFLTVFPQYASKLRWLPWSINPEIIKDWKQEKTINYLLMGLVHYNVTGRPIIVPKEDRYPFRKVVLEKLKSEPGFLCHPHSRYLEEQSKHVFFNEKYAQEINRAKIFFTCGSRSSIGGLPVLKFFEAPGCKSLLLAESNDDIDALGFIDGENFVACTEDDVYQKATYYLDNEVERERITTNGYNFIRQHHTNQVRAEQLIKYITTYLSY
ncbi:hypothetical protein GCM10011351_28620 [Paraliobacillus quinghaiensis]|uniref:Spore protein YkvP/CgeB glycosyl transferase-like domain-containing protein n=1 Tax=Paraliobacillus quinghaiensis TaxID=470815 RepID=A0A917TXR5_9BACI|nr:glycosyltransferase [Paraliobacillus quinghaiensis]GGM40712.1 hypothetical protein GCM10011351_28620 [Paraliobacillus quinghaiensis]